MPSLREILRAHRVQQAQSGGARSAAPDLAKIEADAFADEQNRLLKEQATAERLAKAKARDEEAAQEAARKAALRAQNNATEAEFRAQGRGMYVDADGVIKATQTDEVWQAEQARKKAEQDAEATRKLGEEARRMKQVDVKQREAALAAERDSRDLERQKAKLKRTDREAQIKAEIERRKQISKDIEEGRVAVQNLDGTLKYHADTIAAKERELFAMGEDERAEEAAQLAWLEQHNKARRALEQEEISIPAMKFRGEPGSVSVQSPESRGQSEVQPTPVTSKISASVQAAKEKAIAESDLPEPEKKAALTEMTLLHNDPEAWKINRRRQYEAMKPEELEQALNLTGQKLTERQQAFEAKQAGFVQARQAFDAEMAQIREESAKLLRQPHTAADVTEDGLHRGVADKARAAVERWNQHVRKSQPESDALEVEAAALEVEAQAYNEGVRVAQTRQQQAQKQQRQQIDDQLGELRTNPLTRPFGEQLTRLRSEGEARKLVIEEMFPEEGPERQAALEALKTDLEGQQKAIEGELKATQEKEQVRIQDATTRIYGELRRKLAEAQVGKPIGAGDTGTASEKVAFQEAIEALTQELGGSMEDVPTGTMGLPQRNPAKQQAIDLLRNARAVDWSSGDTEAPTRYLSDGTPIVNPNLWMDRAGFEKAVADSEGSPEQKAKLLADYPRLEAEAAKSQREVLSRLGVFEQWLAKQPADISDVEAVRRFKDENSGVLNAGAWKVRLDQALLGVAQGVLGLGQSVAGVTAAVTRSDRAMDAYTTLGKDAEKLGAASQALPTGQWVNMGTSMLTSTIPSLMGGNLRNAAALAGLQTFGQMYGQAVENYDKAGLSREESLTKAWLPAAAGGLSTLLLTKAGGSKGVEALLRSGRFTGDLKTWLKAVAGGGVQEGLLEEAPDQLIQGFIERHTSNPDKSWAQIAEETLQAGIGGALMGGMFEAMNTRFAPNADNAAPTAPISEAGGRTTNVPPLTPQPAAPEVNQRPEVQAAAQAQIENWQPEKPMAEEAVAVTKARASGLLRIAQGAGLAELSEDELNGIGFRRDAQTGEMKPGRYTNDPKTGELVWKDGPTPANKTYVYSVPDAEGKPQLVIKQGAIDRVKQLMPAVGARIGLSEAERLQQIQGSVPRAKSRKSAGFVDVIRDVGAVIYDLRSSETGEAMDLDSIELALDNAERKLQKGQVIDWPVDRTWLPNVSTASVLALRHLLGSQVGIKAMRERIAQLRAVESTKADTPTQTAADKVISPTPSISTNEPPPATGPSAPTPAVVERAPVEGTAGDAGEIRTEAPVEPPQNAPQPGDQTAVRNPAEALSPAAEVRSQMSEVGEADTSDRSLFNPAAETRVDEISVELERQGMPGAEALRVARAVVEGQGVVTDDYRLQFAAPEFKALVKSAGYEWKNRQWQKVLPESPKVEVSGQKPEAGGDLRTRVKERRISDLDAAREIVRKGGDAKDGEIVRRLMAATGMKEPRAKLAVASMRDHQTEEIVQTGAAQRAKQARVPMIERPDFKAARDAALDALMKPMKDASPEQKKKNEAKIRGWVSTLNTLVDLLDGPYAAHFDEVVFVSRPEGGGVTAEALAFDAQGRATRVALGLDLITFLKHGSETAAGIERTLNEEFEHRGDLMVSSRGEAIALARAIHEANPGVFAETWTRYFALPIANGSMPAKVPAVLDDQMAYTLYFEATRMIRQGKFTTENAEVSKNLPMLRKAWLYLSRWVNWLAHEIKKLPKDLRETWEWKIDAARAVLRKIEKQALALEKAALDDVEPPETAVRNQRAEVRGQKSEDRRQKSAPRGTDPDLDAELEAAWESEQKARRARPVFTPTQQALRNLRALSDPDNDQINVISRLSLEGGIAIYSDKVRKLRKQQNKPVGGELDWLEKANIPPFWKGVIFRKGQTQNIDTVVAQLHKEGYFPSAAAPGDVTGEMLAAKIEDVLTRYAAMKDGLGDLANADEQYGTEMGKLEAQRVAFERATESGPIEVQAAELRVGDRMQVKGADGKLHPVEVIAVDIQPLPQGETFDPEGNPAHFYDANGRAVMLASVTLKDGTTFGVQQIDGESGLFVDEFKVQQDYDWYASLRDAVLTGKLDDAEGLLHFMEHEGMGANAAWGDILTALQSKLRIPMKKAQKMLAAVFQPMNTSRKRGETGPSMFGEAFDLLSGDKGTRGLFEAPRYARNVETRMANEERQAPAVSPSSDFTLASTTPAQLDAEARRKELRDKLRARQDAPLIGTQGDIGQMDMLGGGDLFAQPIKPGDTPRQDAPATPGTVEPDRPRNDAGKPGRPRRLQPVGGEADTDAGGMGQGGSAGQDTRLGGGAAPGSDAAAAGVAGAEPVQGEPSRVPAGPAGSEQPAGSSGFDDPRAAVESGAELDLPPVAPERPARDEVAAERESTPRQRQLEQIAVQSTPSVWDDFKVADAESIARSVPMLLPQQQQDVLKAERRFFEQQPTADDPKKGMLFTNATGTGKTFTGLGIIKRFEMMGKGRVLIVVPNQQKVADWKAEGERVMVKATPLKDTNDIGEDVVVTTYANMRDNWRLQAEPWDLVVYDESHNLSSNAQGTEGANIAAHELVTAKPGWNAMKKWIMAEIGPAPSWDDKDAMARYENLAEQDWKRIQYRRDTAPETRAVFLSATPFAYHKNLKYADGFLYRSPEVKGTGYNVPQGFDKYLVENFGYSMRTNRLTSPGPEVDVGLMEREWAERQFKQGSMTGRMIDVPYDYSREFILLDSQTGKQLDEGFSSLSGWGEGMTREQRDYYSDLTRAFQAYWYGSSLGYTRRMQFLESIKVADALDRMNQHLDLGRKIVLFHSYNNAEPVHPFQLGYLNLDAEGRQLAQEWMKDHPALVQMNFKRLENPRALVANAFGSRVRFFNGEEKGKDRATAIKAFNNDTSGVDILMVQMDAGKEGISLHDVTGAGKQRVLMNAALPVKPTDAIQTEGRIYRIGVMSNAIQEYLVLHTQMERSAFGSKISTRTGTVENMALGKMARTLTDSFKSGYLNAHSEAPSAEQGLGGKKQDAAELLGSDMDRAKSYYFSRMKKTSRNKAAEGVDYFATPEPVGLTMVRFLEAKAGMDLLEPSAGHGAIGRFFPDYTANKFVEPSRTLADELRIKVAAGKVEVMPFEDLHVGANKFDGIAMNPPFGTAGKLAMEHVAKAAQHLRQGGRLVAVIPEGPAMQKRFDQWLENEGRDMHLRASYGLPTVTFERAGTSVKTRIVVLDKADLWTIRREDSGVYAAYDSFGEKRSAYKGNERSVRESAEYLSDFIGWSGQTTIQNRSPRDLSADTINELFDQLEGLEPPSRITKNVATGEVASVPAPVPTSENKAATKITLANLYTVPQIQVVEAAQAIIQDRKDWAAENSSFGTYKPAADARKFEQSGSYTDALGVVFGTLKAKINLGQKAEIDLSGKPAEPAPLPAKPPSPLAAFLQGGRGAILPVSQPSEATRAPITPAPVPEASKPLYEQDQTLHAKRGTMTYVAKMSRRISDAAFNAERTRAKRHGGYWSSFKGLGAIPGFQFPSAEARDQFVAEGSGQALGAARKRGATPAAAPFYSKLSRVIAEKMPNRADVGTIKGLISNPQTAIKAEELKWSGVLPWLESQGQRSEVRGQKSEDKPMISKQAVLDYLASDGAVQLEEVRLGSARQPGYTAIRWTEVPAAMRRRVMGKDEALDSDWLILKDGEPVVLQEGDSAADALDRFDADADEAGTTGTQQTKFAQYQLPGGENYREVVLAMPVPQGDPARFLVVDEKGKTLNVFTTQEQADDFISRNAAFFSATVKPVGNSNLADAYTSSHFPDVPNYVAHARLNDRTDAEGQPGTFIEEIQSDRHQAGREKGYQKDRIPTSAKMVAKTNDYALWDVYDQDGERMGSDKEADSADAALKMVEADKSEGIPDAPFRSTWPLQMFKRALAEAVATDKQWIGWTTGDTQAERYDLSKQVSQVVYVPSEQRLIAYDHSADAREVINQAVPPEKVADYIGKDAAKKLFEQPLDEPYRGAGQQHTLEGDDLKVGGEGMKGFYDTILPKEIGKYVKQWGAGVVKGETMGTKRLQSDAQGLWMVEGTEERFTSRAKALAAQPKTTPIWRVDITPAMRESVEAGQALFAGRKRGGDRVTEEPFQLDNGEIQGYFDLPDVQVPASKQKAAREAIQNGLQAVSVSAAKGADRDAERRAQARRAYGGLIARDVDAIREGLAQGKGRISALIHEFIRHEIPGFNIRGAIIEKPEDFAAFNLAVRSPFFESVKIAVLGDGQQVIHSQMLHVGALNQSIFSPRMIAAVIGEARRANPKQEISGIVIGHNHPSGDPSPSDADKRVTRMLEDTMEVLGVPLTDHVITNGEKYFSFREMGSLRNGAGWNKRKPKLPVLPAPEQSMVGWGNPATGNMADWEAGATSQRPEMGAPEKAKPYLEALATADPGHMHALYLDTRLQLLAVERLDRNADVARVVIESAAREGAYGVMLSQPNQSADPAPSDALRRLVRRVSEALRSADIKLLDAIVGSTNGLQFSFAMHGLIGETADTYTVDEAAHEAATSPLNDLPEPTPAQKEAGNYAKGHVRIAGHEISIENPAGSKRRPEWPALKDHYGYFKGTNAKDGDHVDVFVKPGTPADYAGPVHVVRQNVVQRSEVKGQKPVLTKTGQFDEYKIMLGYPTAEEARKAYLRNYEPGWPGLDRMTTHSPAEFEVLKNHVFTVPADRVPGVRTSDQAAAALASGVQTQPALSAAPKRSAFGAPVKGILDGLAAADWNRIDKALTRQMLRALDPVVTYLKQKGADAGEAMLTYLTEKSSQGQREAGGVAALMKPDQIAQQKAQTKAQMRRAWNAVKRQILPDAAIPADILAKRQEMNSKQALSLEQALDLGKRAFSGKPKLSDLVVDEKFKNPELRRQMFLALDAKIDSGVTLDSLPPDVRRVAEAIQELRAERGREMLKAGLISLDTYQAMEDSMPHYYEQDVKNERNILRKLAVSVKGIFAQRGTAWHIIDTATKDKSGADALVTYKPDGKKERFRFKSEEHRNAYFENELIPNQILAAKNATGAPSLKDLAPDDIRALKSYGWMTDADRAALAGVTRESLMARGKLTKAQRDVVDRLENQLRRRFQKRAPLSYDEHEKAGLIMDPFYAVARHQAEMGHNVAVAEFFNYIAAHPDYVRDAPLEGYTEMPDSTAFGRLAGKYVRDDVAAEVQQMTEVPNMALQLYDWLLSLFKTGHTVLNPGSHVRNVVGNITFAHLAGSNPLNPGNAPIYAQAAKLLRDGGADFHKLYELGILGGDYLTAEVKRTLRQLMPDPETVLREAERGNLTWLMGLKEHMARKLEGLTKLPGAVLTGAENAWRWEDDIYKAAAWLKAKQMGLNDADAAAHVRKWFPFYDKGSSGTLKAFGRFLFPFLSFKRESARILKNALKERPLGALTVILLPRALSQISVTLAEMKVLGLLLGLGLDDERDKEAVLRDLKGRAGGILAPFTDASLFSILLPWRDSEGGLMQWDLSNTHPFGDWLSTRIEDNDPQPWFQRVARQMTSGSPFLGLLYEMADNEDKFTGKRLWEDDMPTSEKVGKMVEHAYMKLAPPVVGSHLRTMSRALDRSPSKLLPERSPGMAAMRAFGGLDVKPANPDLYRDVADYRRQNGLPATLEGVAFPKDAAGRARAELYRLLIQPEIDGEAVSRQLDTLSGLGKPIQGPADIAALFKDRSPQSLMSRASHQQRWIQQLSPEKRRLFNAAVTQQRAALPKAQQALIEARKRSALARAAAQP